MIRYINYDIISRYFHTILFQKFENQTFKDLSAILMPACVILVFVFYGLGVGPVTFALLGEVLPLKVKSFATSIILFLK